jgi:ankyrin repeat protein
LNFRIPEFGDEYMDKLELNERLINAARDGDVGEVGLLIDAGADVDAGEDTPLYYAAYGGHIDVVRVLIDAGAKVEDCAYTFATAAERGHKEVVGALLDAGADVNAMDGLALAWAASRGQIEVAKMLIDAGADIHARDGIALRNAVEFGKAEMVQFLIESGANVRVCREYVFNYLEWLDDFRIHNEPVAILIKNGLFDDSDLDSAMILQMRNMATILNMPLERFDKKS